jgi:hypothetical protein
MMTMTAKEPRTALTAGEIMRERVIGKAPDPDAERKYRDVVETINEDRGAGRITRKKYERLLAEAAAERDRGLEDTRVTYTFTKRGLQPWSVTHSLGGGLSGTFADYPRAVAAAREHHSHSLGAGRARAGQYVRIDVGANRHTGTHVQVLDLAHADSQFPLGDGPRWATFCVDHNTLVRVAKYNPARDAVRTPQEWCTPCREQVEQEAKEVGKA